MKLRINAKLRAALIAAVSVVGFTITSAQAADVTLSNVMNTGGNMAVNTDVWGDTGVISSASASYTITAGSGSPGSTGYTNSFLATRTNVGSGTPGGSYTYTLTFRTAESLANPVTLSSINVDFITYNGNGVGHPQEDGAADGPNRITCVWTLTDTEGGTLSDFSLHSNGHANQSTAAYTKSGETYTTNSFTGGTATLDFNDITLESNKEYTLTLAVSKKGGANGFFVGIGNVALINTPEVKISTWNGTEGHSTWADADAWSGTPFADGGAAVFDGNAAVKTATVTADVTAESVTVGGAAHEFALAGGNLTTGTLTVSGDGSLALTGTGTVAAATVAAEGKTISLAEGVTLQGVTTGQGTLTGAGKYKASSASNVLAGLATAQSGWTGTIDATVVDDGTNLLTLLTNANIHGGTVQLQSKGSAVTPGSGSSETSLQTNLAGTGRQGDYTLAGTTFTTGGALRFNDWANNHSWIVGAGTALQVGGDLWMDHGNKLVINNGSVTVGGKLLLGHSGGSNPTGLVMSGANASLKAATIDAYSNSSASDKHIPVSITGGTVEFTTTGNALQIHNSAVCDVTIGGSGSDYVTLKADSSSWQFAYDGMTIGNVAAQTAGGKTITLGATGMTANYAGALNITDGSSLKLDGTIARTTSGSIAVSGTLTLADSLVFNLSNFAYTGESTTGTYTVFAGGSVSLAGHNYTAANITGVDTVGKVWSFNDNGTITWTLPSDLVWDGAANNKWSYTDANWTGSPFVANATANFLQDADVEVSGNVVANSIVVGAGEAAANVTVSAGEASSLTASTLQVDNGSLITNVTIQGLGSNTLAAGTSWHIAADQTIAAGAIDGSVDVAQGKTVTLVQAATAKDLLLGITGEGNITLGTSVSFDSADDAAAASTKATGTLTLKEGVKLTVGNNKDKTASIASFNHVVMEQGAGIETKSRLVEINNLTVNTDASHTDVIKMLDTYNKDEVALNLKGTTTLDGNLEINSSWKYKVNIETLDGTGTLYLKGGSNEQHTASIGGGSVGKLDSTSGSVATSITDTTLGALELTSGSLTANGNSRLGDITIGGGTTLTVAEGATVTATSISVQDNNKATLNINGTLDVSGNFYAIGCSNTTDIIGSGEGSALTVGSLDICNFGTNFNLQNITMTVSGKANAGDYHNNNKTHIDLNAGSALNLLGEVTFNTNESKYCTLNVNGGALTAGTDAAGDTARTFQDIVAGADGGTVNFLNGANTVATLNMAAGDLAVTVGEHATLTIENATLKSTITGAVTFTGTVDITNHVISDRTDVYTGGETPGDVNGFRSTTGKMVMATGTVTDEGATYMFGGTDVSSDVVGGVYNVSTETDYTHFYINEGTETLSHAIAGATTLSSVVMSGGTLVADGESVNLEIAEGAAVTLNVTEETTISSLSGTGSTLYITGDSVVTLAANSSMTSTIDIAGTATVKMGEHEALGNAANSITVHTGATLDINGKDAPAGKLYTLTLAGGTYANTGSELSWGSRQLVKALVVTDDSTINAESHDFGLINGGYDPTTLDLGATLEKVGSHNFYIVHSTITGDGAFKVTEGGLFFDYNVNAGYRGTLAADFLMNGGSVGGTIVLADDISVSAVAGGSTFNAAVINGGHTITFDGADDLTVGGVISGEGGIIKDGAGTLTLNGTQTYTGTTVVKGGRLVVNGSLVDDNAISVEGDATIGGNVDTTLVGIASTKTATFEEGIVTESGAIFSEGAQVTNNAGVTAKYGIDNANMAVTADSLMVADESEVVVRNEVQLDDVTVGAFGSLTLDNVPEAQLELDTMTIGAGAFVSVYTSDEHTTEATVVISDTLTAGGGTLLANLTLKDDSTLDLSIDGYVVALTLGSTLTVAPEGGLVTLDAVTIAALEALDVNESLELVSAAFQTELAYGGNYNDLWFGQLFERVPGVEGDYRVYANGTSFGLTKVSNTPEPTTGTLSLLALMALAARRRRH